MFDVNGVWKPDDNLPQPVPLSSPTQFAQQQAVNEKAAGQSAYAAGQSPGNLSANTAPINSQTGLPEPQNSQGQTAKQTNNDTSKEDAKKAGAAKEVMSGFNAAGGYLEDAKNKGQQSEAQLNAMYNTVFGQIGQGMVAIHRPTFQMPMVSDQTAKINIKQTRSVISFLNALSRIK